MLAIARHFIPHSDIVPVSTPRGSGDVVGVGCVGAWLGEVGDVGDVGDVAVDTGGGGANEAFGCSTPRHRSMSAWASSIVVGAGVDGIAPLVAAGGAGAAQPPLERSTAKSTPSAHPVSR